MNKVILILCIVIATVLSFVISSRVYAQKVYGCAKHEIIAISPGICPICGKAMESVREGYIMGPQHTPLLDSNLLPQERAYIRDNPAAAAVVIYVSAAGERSFAPGRDSQGNLFQRNFAKFKYNCGDYITNSELPGRHCVLIGDNRNDAVENWNAFYDRHSRAGMSDEEIKEFWETYKKLHPNKVQE